MLALRWFYLLGICACACAAQQELPTAAATGATTEKIFANQTEEPVVSVPGMWRQARRRNTLADSCTTNGGATGTCLTRFKCMRQGGTVNGYCGTYGVCCESKCKSCLALSM